MCNRISALVADVIAGAIVKEDDRKEVIGVGSAILGLSQVERVRAGAAQEETTIVVVWISGSGSKPVNTDGGVAC